MAPARALALLCIALCTGAAAASGRGLLATSEAVDVTAVDLPVMPELELANFTELAQSIQPLLMTLAAMPADALTNSSIIMGYVLAPLMLRRGPIGAQLGAPHLDNMTAPAGVNQLPERIQKLLGFKTPAPAPAAAGGLLGALKADAAKAHAAAPASKAPVKGFFRG